MGDTRLETIVKLLELACERALHGKEDMLHYLIEMALLEARDVHDRAHERIIAVAHLPDPIPPVFQ